MKSIISLFVLVLSAAFISANLPAKDGLKVGDTASDFSLKNVDGSMVSLANYEEANGYVVVFTCNHCPYAVMYEDRLIELHEKYAPQGYPVIAINPNDPEVQPGDSYEKMKVRAEEKAFPFAYLFDEGQEILPKYGAKKTPHVFLLDKELTVQYIGAIDDSARDASAVKETYLANAIEALKLGESPDPSFTKAIGCSVKTKGGGKKWLKREQRKATKKAMKKKESKM